MDWAYDYIGELYADIRDTYIREGLSKLAIKLSLDRWRDDLSFELL